MSNVKCKSRKLEKDTKTSSRVEEIVCKEESKICTDENQEVLRPP
jgi:hypothetical protein